MNFLRFILFSILLHVSLVLLFSRIPTQPSLSLPSGRTSATHSVQLTMVQKVVPLEKPIVDTSNLEKSLPPQAEKPVDSAKPSTPLTPAKLHAPEATQQVAKQRPVPQNTQPPQPPVTPEPKIETSNTSENEFQDTTEQEKAPSAVPWIEDADYKRNPLPRYPRGSRRRKEQGLVVLQVQVSPQGRAQSVVIHSSSGHRLLDVAASEAVEKWEFTPARTLEGRVTSTVLVPIEFKLQS